MGVVGKSFEINFNKINELDSLKFIPIPASINYIWNLGSLLGITLVIQLIRGILISIHYSSYVEVAFDSVIHISRDVSGGWIIRYTHIRGASMFFVLIFSHILKNFFNTSHRIIITWNSGTIILLLLIATAFLGYVLPWGQISFWAATVITNILSAIPFWGKIIVNWLWGGFSVDYPTLNRFFSLHFLLPFIITVLVLIHLLSLHTSGSSNPININIDLDKIGFFPFFVAKDILGIILFFTPFFLFIIYDPFFIVDVENFIPANPIVTPVHIQPEWYFLYAYAILRSIPSKLGGVVSLVISILILIVKPLQNQKKESFKFSPINKIKIVLFIQIFYTLSVLGKKSVEYPFEILIIIYRVLYFIIVLIL